MRNAASVEPVSRVASAAHDFSGAPRIAFEKLTIGLPRGTRIGAVQGGILCVTKKALAWDFGPQAEEPGPYADAFREELEKAGFPVSHPTGVLFQTEAPPPEDLVAGAVVEHLRADLCFPLGGYGNFVKEQGHGEIGVSWQIYSRKRREVLFRAKGTGTGHLPKGSGAGVLGIALDAFADATRNLLADPAFQRFIDAYTAAPAETLAPIEVKAAPPLAGPVRDHMTALRSAVVTVTFHDGHGSGFVIDPRGYVLTNAHVVQEARFVTVRLVTGTEVVGEVVRVDAERDVALVKLEEGHLAAVPVRATEPGVGDEVYAVGSPLSETLRTSVTRGVVSGFRERRGLRFIQSDVSIQPGNSGGPLVDGSGNVVGISAEGLFAGDAPVGLNFFIPIGDALERLQVRFGDTDAPGG